MNRQSQPVDVTVSDIMRLALPLNTTVQTGEGRLSRAVSWVILLTSWQDLTSQIKEGDLVIVPPHLLDQVNEKLFLGHIQAIIDLAAVALLTFSKIKQSVATVAEANGFPILVPPAEAAVRDLHRDIVALLIDKQSVTSERSMQLYRRLSTMSREGKSLADMADVMSQLTGKIIVIQDKRLEIKTLSVPQGVFFNLDGIKEAIVQRDLLPKVLRNRKAAAKTKQTHWHQPLPVPEIGRLIAPIISGDRARGYLSLISYADQLDLLDSLTVEHGAAACALEMAKAKAVSEAKKSLRGDFLEGVLAGNLAPKEIARQAGRLDHDTSEPHAVITLTWSQEDAPSLRHLETSINWLLRNHNRPALVHIYGDIQHICVFQSLRNDTDLEIAKAFARRIVEEVGREYPGKQLIGGMSGPAATLAEWPQIYEEAIQAMQLGQRLNLNRIVEFDSLGVYRLLGRLEHIEEVRAFVQDVIGPLVEYDEQHNSTMLKTLDAYFNHHGNISQTAESLYIHRNTLLYRLDRIEELSQHDLNRANMRLALHLSLKLWQLSPDNEL